MYRVTIAAARVNVGMNQQEAAKALGVSNKTLSKWEKGESFPPVDKVAQMCDLYKVPYELLNFLPNNSL